MTRTFDKEMKGLLITLSSFVGTIVILIVAFFFISAWLIPSSYDTAIKEFGTPESLASISELYERIETDPHNPKLEVVKDHQLDSLRVRNIPKSFLREQFGSRWGLDLVGKSTLGGNYVLAHYGEGDVLEGIEFRGSRYGCYASRKATRFPSRYTSLHRIATQPIYVSIRITKK